MRATKSWILLANPAYSHLPALVAQEGASNANGKGHVGARGRSPNLATWRFNWGSPTVSGRFPCRHNWHRIPRRFPKENLLRKTLQVSECGPVYSDGGRPYEVIIRTTVATRDGS